MNIKFKNYESIFKGNSGLFAISETDFGLEKKMTVLNMLLILNIILSKIRQKMLKF